MSKNKETETDTPAASGKGRTVEFMVDGVMTKRVDYIRNRYYGEDGVHGEDDPKRGDILKEVRELQGDDSIPYQIIFAATKTPERPVPKPRGKQAEEVTKEATE